MKKTIFYLFMLLLMAPATYAQVGIKTDGTNADNSAMLDVESTSLGFLPPRMSEAERDAIPSPAEGLVIYNTDDKCLNVFTGDLWNNLCVVAFKIVGPDDVYSNETGEVWMDRNLGASQVATSSTDDNAYGDLYQWGRLTDGHESRNSGTTNTQASSDTPGHDEFIIGSNDWLAPQNDNLWQGVNGTNNPCPSGYRVPTEAELDAERLSWGSTSTNAAGAFASPLKLPVAGCRFSSDGLPFSVGSYGYYWSSTVVGSNARYLYFGSTAGMNSSNRAYGFSVRCIKD